MLKRHRNFAPLYFNDDPDAGGGGGSGGEGEGSPTSGFTQEDLDAAVQEAVTGLKNKNKELLGSLAGVKEDLKKWDGLDPTKVRDMLDKFENDEELQLIAEGKHEEAWQKRLDKVGAKHQTELEGLTSKLSEATTALEASEKQVRTLMIDNTVVTTFASEKGLESAIPDVILRAQREGGIEEGQLIFRDSDGEIRRGKDGAMTAQEWVADLKNSAPHLFPQSQGAGATGSGRGGGSDLESRMAAAAAEGNMEEYRRLHREKRKDQKAS